MAGRRSRVRVGLLVVSLVSSCCAYWKTIAQACLERESSALRPGRTRRAPAGRARRQRTGRSSAATRPAGCRGGGRGESIAAGPRRRARGGEEPGDLDTGMPHGRGIVDLFVVAGAEAFALPAVPLSRPAGALVQASRGSDTPRWWGARGRGAGGGALTAVPPATRAGGSAPSYKGKHTRRPPGWLPVPRAGLVALQRAQAGRAATACAIVSTC